MKLRFFKKPPPKDLPPPPPESSSAPGVKNLDLARTVQDVIAPQSISVDFNHLKINDYFFRSYFTAINRRFVDANWLSALINFDHSLNISMFIYPVESKSTLDELRRKIAEMEAEISTDMQRGRVVDPGTQAKLEDALSLQEQLVKGIERFFQFSLYVTVPAESLSELETTGKQVGSTLSSLLVGPFSTVLQQPEGFKTTLPTSSNHLMVTRNMDTTSLATTFPFTSSELTSNEGVLFGINEHNGSLIIFDRFSLVNANTVVFAKAGAGKCLDKSAKTLISDSQNNVKLVEIGQLVDEQIRLHGATPINPEMEGVIFPGLKALTFDQNLNAHWATISVAARKKFSPRNRLYTITTKSGRQITVTADHNLILMRQAKIRVMRSEAVKIGESLPLPRIIPGPVPTTSLSPHYLTLLGLITSEGYISQNFVRIFNTDPSVLKIIDCSFHSLGIKHSPLRSRGLHLGYSSGSSFASQIINQGASGRSGTKRVPPIIFSLSNIQVAHYLRAYYEGDGGVETHEVNATTKSKDLSSDLTYLLLRFGIVARIRTKHKSATNTSSKTKGVYYQVTISGKDNLEKFAHQIGFLTAAKNARLKQLLESIPVGNTNTDTIPSLEPIFNSLYQSLYPTSEIKAPQIIVDLKNGEYQPSRTQLLTAINLCEKRISELRSLSAHIELLKHLPPVSKLITIGSKSRRLNHLLWQQLGQSWRVMKRYLHPPLAQNVLLAYQTITGHVLSLPQVTSALYSSFKYQGVSLQEYDKSLWTTVVLRQTHNSRYSPLFQAARFIARKYRSTQLKIRHSQEKLAQLRLLANSDLFWDPIVKIERIKHKEKYVYDLQVDNGVFLAGDGGLFVHNSYMVKLEILRSLMFGTEIIVIDPENEYRPICEVVGGDYINFSYSSQNRINPFDLSALTEFSEENELNLKIQSLHSLFKVIMGTLNPTEEALLDRALTLAYRMKGITPDPLTQKKTPPLMEDLYKAFIGMEEPQAASLADRLEKFVKGSFTGIIDQPSNVALKNPFTVFSVRDLEDTLKPIAIFIILDYIWTKLRRDLKKRILVVDEAWYLMRYPDSANFLYGIAKRARKYFLGLTTITQDVEDFLNTDFGKAIVTNSSIQVLLKQSPAAVDRIAQIFYLSEGEKHLLLSANVGEGLFFAGNNHVAARFLASPDEHQLVTTKPQELLAQKAAAPSLRLVPTPESANIKEDDTHA